MAITGVAMALLVAVSCAMFDTALSACDQKYLLIDVTAVNSYSWPLLKTELRPYTTLFAFRVPATKRFIIVIQDPGSTALEPLNIPAVSSRVYRVERGDNFFTELGASRLKNCNNVSELKGEELKFLEIDCVMTGLDMKKYKAKMSWIANMVGNLQKKYSIHMFYVIDSLPAKVFVLEEGVPVTAADVMNGFRSPDLENINVTPVIRLYDDTNTSR